MLTISYVVRYRFALGQKLSNVLDPVSELAPLLIKPVQRLCKYPLLLAVSTDPPSLS